MINFKIACYAMVSLFMVASCAPSTANKTDSTSAQAGSAPLTKGSSPTKGEGDRGSTRESPTDRSSLSQLQEGKSTAEGSGPLKDIYFDFDSASLSGDAREILRANATWLKGNAAARAEIEGHSDERGTNEYNLALGAKRAQTAKDFLATLGIGADRLSTISYGEEIPMCKDASENCWQRNRRARFRGAAESACFLIGVPVGDFSVKRSFMKLYFYGLIVGSAIWLIACVQPQQVELIEREQRRLRGDTSQAQKGLDSVRVEIDSVRSSLADTRANLQQLQREFSGLKERIEETRFQVGRQIGQSTREGDQRVKDLEARVAKLGETMRVQEEILKSRDGELKELRDSLQQAQSAAAAAGANEAMVADSSAGETAVVKRDYEIAWHAMEKRDYRLAITRFKDFLKRHPKSNLADNAQFWIGESHYGLREFDQAIIEFDAVRRRYPQGESPAALLKQGYAFAELGEKLNARLLLQEVVEKYPDTPEAGKAKLRLKTIES